MTFYWKKKKKIVQGFQSQLQKTIILSLSSLFFFFYMTLCTAFCRSWYKPITQQWAKGKKETFHTGLCPISNKAQITCVRFKELPRLRCPLLFFTPWRRRVRRVAEIQAPLTLSVCYKAAPAESASPRHHACPPRAPWLYTFNDGGRHSAGDGCLSAMNALRTVAVWRCMMLLCIFSIFPKEKWFKSSSTFLKKRTCSAAVRYRLCFN